MKKRILVVSAFLVLTVSGLALAQMDKGKDMMGAGMMKSGMMGGKMMGMCPMMQSMIQKQVVSTGDGGFVVVAGNKITKYDKDLNVVKEVEQKMDMAGMKKMMEEMKSMCPMMGKGMDDKKEEVSGDEAVGRAAPADDHTGHHPENE